MGTHPVAGRDAGSESIWTGCLSCNGDPILSLNPTAQSADPSTTVGRKPIDPQIGEPSGPPVVFVDLDGTLHSSDVFAECLIQACLQRPSCIGELAVAALAGRAALKRTTAEMTAPDVSTLPWRQDVLALLATLRDAGCRIVLATATDAIWAGRVADHLTIFDDVLASDGKRNLKGQAKLDAILEYCRQHGFSDFAYLGDSTADLAIWPAAAEAWVVNAAPSVERQVRESHDNVRVIGTRTGSARSLLRALRPVQWLKNCLLFVPLLLAHQAISLARVLDVAIAFVAMSLCASAVYILNDLMDLRADRRHPTKKHRPLAAGELSPHTAVLGGLTLLGGGFVTAVATLPLSFTCVLAAYLCLTLLYTIWLKREAMADVIVLAGLYTLRVFAGGEAGDIVVSDWLLTLSVFLFTSLAFAKRHAELSRLQSEGNYRAKGRGYVVDDLPLVRTLGACSGYLAVLVFAMYSQSERARELYVNPWALWLICPLALFWIGRLWLIAVRGQLHEDPVVFALKDRVSLFVTAAVASLLLLAAARLPWTL